MGDQIIIGSELVSGSHKELAELMSPIWNANLSLMLHGSMGIGKTDFFAAFAKAKAAELKLRYSEDLADINKEDVFMFIPFIAHQMDLAEIQGLMYPNEDRTKTIRLPLGNLPTAGQGIILFDEINLALPSVQNNLYQLVQKAQLGFYKVPAGYRCYAAGNRIEDRANIYEMPLPLNNRMLHFLFNTPTAFQWINDYAVPHQADHRIIAFLARNPEYIYWYLPDSNEDVKAFPTPRSWKYASDAILPIKDLKLAGKLVGLAVGKALGLQWEAFIRLTSTYDLAKIYATRKLQMPREIDLIYSLTSGLVTYYRDEIMTAKKKEDQESGSEALFEIAMQFDPEYTAMMISQAASVDPSIFTKMKSKNPALNKVFTDAMTRLLL